MVRDYLAGTAPAAGFYQGAPDSLASFRHKLEEVRERFGREERARAARALHPTSERARERLHRLVEQGGVVVTTGQQAGLFTGPLYTIHKALTLVRLAEALERELQTLVVPVFWVASEDHDWDEVNHACFAVGTDQVHRVQLDGAAEPPLPMADRRLGDGVRNVLDEASQLIGSFSFAEGVLTSVRDAYRPENTVAGGFARLLHQLLSPFDVCLTDAADPALKQASAPLLRQALGEASRHEAVLATRGAALREAGYAEQVAVLPEATNVFWHGEAGRFRIYRQGGGFAVPETGERWDESELLARVEREPGRFSPNVFLRPVVESAVFPTLAYVAGPGEISYFAQVNALFPEFGLEPPVVVPRASVLLVEPAMQRLLEKLELEAGQLRAPRHELAELLAQRAMPPEVAQTLQELTGSVNRGYARLIESAGAIDPPLQAALASLRNQVLAQIDDSERKVVRHLKRRQEIALSQLDRLRANLVPDGEPQERVLNVLPLLARYGPELLREIAAAIHPKLG